MPEVCRKFIGRNRPLWTRVCFIHRKRPESVTNPSGAGVMESKKYYPQAEDDAEATLVEPRFDEEAKEAARPVVPLSQVKQADLYAATPSRMTARRGRSPWQSPLVIMLAVVALAAVVTAAAIYRSTRRTAPSAAPQTVNETTVEPEPETVVSAPEPAPEQSTAAQARENGTAAPAAPPPRESEARAETPAREEPERSWHKNEERRDRDEEKSAERARKDEKKEAKRKEKEAERTAEKRGDPEKREETRPRLVGIYVEGRKKP